MTNIGDIVRLYSAYHFGTGEVCHLRTRTHQVYLAKDKIIKIYTVPLARNEAFLLQLYRMRGIPTPEVIHIDTSHKFFDNDVLVTEYIPHSHSRHYHNYAEMGQLLALMHTIALPGIGFININTCTGTSRNWQEFLTQRMTPYQSSIEQATGKPLEKLLPPLDNLPECHTLLHRDYARHNVLFRRVDEQVCIAGVVDPVGAIGDPFLDVANAILNLPPPYKEQFLLHYRPQGLTKNEQERLHTYTILALLQKTGAVRTMLQQQKPNKNLALLHRRQASYLARLKKERII